MKINLLSPITDVYGRAIPKTKDGPNGEIVVDGAMLLRDVFVNALGSPIKGDEHMLNTVEDKLRIARLAERAATNDVIDWTVEDVALAKQRIGVAYTQIVVMRAFDLIEAAAQVDA